MKPGYLYYIKNKENGYWYVGSSISPETRWKSHKKSLLLGKHCNKKLQNSWNKYGESCFVFEIGEKYESDKLSRNEEHKILLENVGKEHCFNLSKCKYGNDFSEYTREKLRLSNINKKPISDETREKLRTYGRLGYERRLNKSGQSFKHSEETKKKLREIGLNKKPISEATREKMRAAGRWGYEMRMAKNSRPILPKDPRFS